MAFKLFRMGGGLQTKAAADAIPDNGLTVCRYCGFDEVGTVTSARGREYGNQQGGGSGVALGGSGSVVGGFDGLLSSARSRWIKRGSAVYTGTVDATDPLGQDAYTTSVGTLANPVYKLSAPTWSSGDPISGFCYGDYAYMADGTGMGRYKAGASPLMQAWGLTSPGYHEFSGSKADPLSINTAVDDNTVKVTVAGGHGLGLGLADSPSYPYTMNIEIVGTEPIAGIPDNEINTLHSGYAGSSGADLAIVDDGSTLAAGGTYTITYQNNAGLFDWSKVNVDVAPDGAALSGGSITSTTVTQGDNETNEVQSITYSGTVTAGNFKLKFSRGGGDYDITADIPYDATAAEVLAACLELRFFSSGSATTTTCSVTSATEFTFDVTTAGTGGSITGGGSAGFMRQGPTLTAATGGALVSGEYYYAYTFYNGVAESNFSAQVPVAVSTGDKVTLTNILRGPEGTTERRIYRTDVNGRQLYYIGTIEDNTTLTYTDTAKLAAGADPFAQPGDEVTDAENPANSSDQQARGRRANRRGVRESAAVAKANEEKLREQLATNLGLLSDWTDHDPPPTNLKEVGMLGETCFGISGSTLRFSSAGNPEHWPLSNQIKPGRNTSETLRQWVAFDRDCIMYTDNALYRLTQVGLDFEDSRFEEIESPVGLAGNRAVAALDGQQGHLFLAKSGLYLFDGARVQEVSFPIEKLFTDSTHADYIHPAYMSSAIMVTSRDRMFMAYANGASGNDRLLIADFQDVGDPKFTVLSWSLTSLWRDRYDNSLLAGDSSGYLWQLDYGWSDEGAGTIAWSLATKEFPLHDGSAFRLDEVVLDADLAGATTTITATTMTRSTTKSQAFTSTANGRQRLVFKCPVWMKGERVKVAISSSSDTKRSLHAVGFTYLPMDEV